MRNGNVSSALTVYHDGQFWVGLIEHVEDGRYGVRRIVFGAEPSAQELLDFVCKHWGALDFAPPFDAEKDGGAAQRSATEPRKSPKRLQREAGRAIRAHGPSTKAQEVLAAEREQEAARRHRTRASQKRERKDAQFERKSKKRKQKRRGH